MSYLDDLVTIENDAFSNLYDIEISLPTNIEYEMDNAALHLRLRSQDVTIPEPKIDTYDVHYKTVSIKKPKAKVLMERKIELEFRVDSNYEVYKTLKSWGELLFSKDGRYEPPKSEGDLGVITITTFNAATDEDASSLSQKQMTWKFTSVWFAGFDTGVALKRTASDELKVKGTFYFIGMTQD